MKMAAAAANNAVPVAIYWRPANGSVADLLAIQY